MDFLGNPNLLLAKKKKTKQKQKQKDLTFVNNNQSRQEEPYNQ